VGNVAVLSAHDVADVLRARGMDVIECAPGSAIDRELQMVAPALDAIVVGRDVTDPIQTAQRAYQLDPTVSVILLATRDQLDGVRGALRFTPFIGKDVECDDVDSAEDVALRVTSAAQRTRARRTHQLRLAAANAALERAPSSASVPPREQFLAQLVDTVPIGIIALDRERRVLSFNHEASRLLGQSEREALGKPLGHARLGLHEPRWDALLDEAARTRAAMILDASGERSLEIRVAQLSGSSGEGYLVTLQDVTERARAAEARNAALARAEEVSRLKDEFIAMASHELRTPMNAIVGWSRIIRQGKTSPERVQHALEVIERNATLQAKLIEDLLDFSRIIGGKMRVDVRLTSLRAVVERGFDSVRVAANAKGVALVSDLAEDLPEVMVDEDRLQQIIWNLLSNSVKFSARGGTVRVVAARKQSAVLLEVEDQGEGIAPEVLPYVFDPFRQAEGGTTRRHGGLGLGLAIARRLAELHGGNLTATSAGVGLGATFTLRLPIHAIAVDRVDDDMRAAARASVASSALGHALAGYRILVVDDDGDTRDLVAAVLAAAGAEVEQADSARAALDRLSADHYDLLVSDIGMPLEDGYSLIKQLRDAELRRVRRVPAIALTAYARAADHAQALAAGFDAHVAKPIDPGSLVAIARDVLSGHAG
jgi:PAS domain S-box-containing protein